MGENRLTRSEVDKVIAGVCGGLAAYLDIDPVLVRILFVILMFASGIGAVIYLVLWFIMPVDASQGGTARSNFGSAVLKENLDDLNQTVSSGARRLGQPGTIGVLLILLGGFFLLNQLGWFGWLGGLFWPLLIVGVGVYLFSRRNRD